jgi:TRAP-type mannitol/chloroaromatic compound transport system substrate-binding protein
MRKFTLLVMISAIAMALAFGSTAFSADKIKWRMGSTWTPAINLYHGDKAMIQYLKEMTDGRFEITWYPSGSLMKAFEYFDACSKGVVEAVGDWSSYWVTSLVPCLMASTMWII